MSDVDLCFTPATELARRIRAGELSALAVTENALARIAEVNPVLNCFCFVYEEQARAAAAAADQALAAGRPLGPLHGVPVAFKDLTPMRGLRTTLGSRRFAHWVPDHDPVIVRRITAAGAIVVGKTTTPEFAFDSFTHSPLWGVTRNPWDPARTPGGSSGGSAAAVASGCVALAEGTDMAGSIRIPAACCGVVGLKPGLGRIPMDILPTVFDNISHFGPLSRTVRDAALFLQVAHGPDDADPMSLARTDEFVASLVDDVRGLRLAVSRDFGYYAVDPAVAKGLADTVAALAADGAVVEEVSLGWTEAVTDGVFDLWGVFLAALFGDDLEQWRPLLDPNVVAIMERGMAIDAVSYKRIELLRTRLWRQLGDLFEHYDALLCPTTAIPAPAAELTDADFGATDAAGRFHGFDMTGPFNLVAPLPVLSVPCGWSAGGLPVGMQIVGRRHAEATVLRIAAAVERLRPWGHRRPMS